MAALMPSAGTIKLKIVLRSGRVPSAAALVRARALLAASEPPSS